MAAVLNPQNVGIPRHGDGATIADSIASRHDDLITERTRYIYAPNVHRRAVTDDQAIPKSQAIPYKTPNIHTACIPRCAGSAYEHNIASGHRSTNKGIAVGDDCASAYHKLVVGSRCDKCQLAIVIPDGIAARNENGV